MRWTLPTALLLLSAAAAAAEPPAAENTSDSGTLPAPADAPANVLTRAPVLKAFVEAPYPAAEEAAKREGEVVLEITIGADGTVSDPKILQSAGEAFDAAALEAVSRFVFEPAEIDHVAAAVRVHYRYAFTLRPPAPTPVDPATPAPNVLVLEGRALERGTRVPLAGATVIAERDGTVVEAGTDSDGTFRFRDLAPGAWSFVLARPGFERFQTTETIRAGEVVQLVAYVRRRAGEFEAIVRAPREKKEVARRTLTLEEIRRIPGTNGDALKVIQNLPGVSRTPLNLGPPIVRGGRIGDTRTYVDGQLVPLLFHFGGLTSVLNSEFVEALDFYPGNPPVRYGRSVAGAIDVTTRDGRRARHHGFVDVSITEASLFAEGPLGSNGAYMASARRSYFELALPVVFAVLGGGDQFRLSPQYWDYQLKADFDLGADDLSFFLFGSDDRLRLVLTNPALVSPEARNDFSTSIGFHRLTTLWKRRLAEGLDHRLAITLGTDATSNTAGSDLRLDLHLLTATVREEVTWKLSESLKFQAGLDAILSRFEYGIQGPPLPAPGEFLDPTVGDDILAVSDSGYSAQPALWLDAVLTPAPWLRVVPGVRVDHETYMDRTWFDPRVSAFAELVPELTFKASAGVFHQPPLPQRLTKTFGNPELTEEGSRQYAAGVEWSPGGLFELDLQAYWKDLFQESVRTATAVQRPNGAWERVNWVNTGEGRAYGLELLLRRPPTNGFFGWIALSLGDAQRRSSPTEPWITASFAQRYSFIGVASYRLPLDFQVGARLRWIDGNPATRLVGSIFDSDANVHLPLPGDGTHAIRRPAFFQLDLRVDRRWVFEQWVLDAYLDVQNVTNRCNVEGVSTNYDFTEEVPLCGIPILPTFGVRREF